MLAGIHGILTLHEGRARHSNQTNEYTSNTSPVEATILLVEEDNGKNGGENDHRSTKHLPHRGIEVEQTNIHQTSSNQITHSRGSDIEIMLAMLNRVISLRNQISLSILLSLALSSATGNLVHNQAGKHTNEHRLCLEPGLLEINNSLTRLSKSLHTEYVLLDNDSCRSEQKHSRNAGLLSELTHHSTK